MIIARYLIREVSLTLSAVTGILLVTFISNQFARYLNKAAGGSFASDILLRLIMVEIPHLLSILIPLGLFLGILLAYSRLYADNEMTVMKACGLSLYQLVKFTLPVTTVTVVILLILCLWINPNLASYRNKLLAETGPAVELQTTIPGRFREADGGKRIFYAESISADKQKMRDIFVAQLANTSTPNKENWIIATANDGYQTVDSKNGDRFFVTVNGQRYQGEAGQKDFEIVQFKKFGLRIESYIKNINKQVETLPTVELWKADKERTAALTELQWRLAPPISALLLSLLAIPLSHVKQRHGRYAQILPAILIYIVYTDLLVFAHNWMEQNTISVRLGLWWIYGLLGIVILIVWSREIGWARIKQLLKRKP